jgi:Methyltransferase domain
VPYSYVRTIERKMRLALNRVGIDVHRHSTSEWRWSYHIDDYHPVNPITRWGYGNPAHPEITEVLDRRRGELDNLLGQLAQCHGALAAVPLHGQADSVSPYWTNGWFENFDAAALIAMLVSYRPQTYFEIGSGQSTKFARYAIQYANLPTSVISLDPEPRANIDVICDKVIRCRLEDYDLSEFDRLESGDMLFFDGSHRVFPNSDVTVFFLEIMPRLKAGVIVQIHDIFLPWDYPPEFNRRLYSEQYLLASMLLCPQPMFNVLLPNFFICQDPDLSVQVASLMRPFGCIAQGWSFWLQKK